MAKTTWQIKQHKYPQLKQNLSANVVIVGGGMAGVFCAYELAQRGFKSVLLEAKTLGNDATMQTTAFITHDIDTDLDDLISMFGRQKAKMVWESGRAAINKIANIIKTENIDCEFINCPLYVLANKPEDYKNLQTQKEAANKLGFKTKLINKLQSFPNAGALEIPGQAKFHPLKFLNGLAQNATQQGAKIFENSEVIKIIYGKSLKIKTKKYTLTAKKIILATYDPIGNPIETKFKKGMYNSYVYELKIPKNCLPEATYLDTQNPYNYFRVDRMGSFDRMVIGGQDNRSELRVSKQKHFRALRDVAKKILGKNKFKTGKKWVGPILEPSDGLPLIGQYKDNCYLACAFSGNGMTYSAISAMLISDLVQNKKNAWEKLYNPKR
ncbi:MAG TPA: FAD-binding oxidoreductase, partial [Candidatus Limnocylindria bacterium]|nr:FAD-binding oxidoreductase [Candidatus Limnocylindria bacterium]